MKKLFAWIWLIAIYVSFIAPFSLTANAQKSRVKTMPTNTNQNMPNGLQFRLSEGVTGAETREKQPVAETNPLSQNETGNLLKRIPAIKPEAGDQTDFAKRAGTLPAPKTGVQIPVKFPAPEQLNPRDVDQSKLPLEVVRFSPAGEVKLAPDLNVTFSQPMVAVTSQEQAAQIVPVQVTPLPEGNWRWLGTKTLMFDTKSRFPMATKFTVRVPAGTKSANNQTLQKDVVWTFTTPPPKVETMIPQNQITRRDALMFVSFDQEINAEAVIKTISVTAQGKRLPIRPATQAEIETDSSVSYYAKTVQPKRWIAFRAINSDGLTENALPGASQITVTIEKGTTSAEGPLTTTQAQSFGFQTYSPLKFQKAICGWEGNPNCSPFEQWFLQFNNQIDTTNFTAEMVKIEPAVENLKIYPGGNNIYIQGYKKGRTTYKITVDGSLKDIYGQTLAAPATATIKVGSAPVSLYSQGGTMVVLDPTAKPAFSVYSTNQPSVKVRLYSVEPTDWKAFQEYFRRINYDDSTKKPAIPGRLISDKVVNIENKPDEMVETRIDLSEALNAGFGSVIIDIEPTVKRDKYDRARIFTWAQSTNIGLDAFVDSQELVGFATDLKTGKPISGVELSIYPNGKQVVQSPKSKV
ncbi:MAG: Ig-like domain-containing protein, partial [Pyrinomonadaceae bacterium]|nr:Ig-like domain-containing protein [Pyrinomonadaceae bacterium]